MAHLFHRSFRRNVRSVGRGLSILMARIHEQDEFGGNTLESQWKSLPRDLDSRYEAIQRIARRCDIVLPSVTTREIAPMLMILFCSWNGPGGKVMKGAEGSNCHVPALSPKMMCTCCAGCELKGEIGMPGTGCRSGVLSRRDGPLTIFQCSPQLKLQRASERIQYLNLRYKGRSTTQHPVGSFGFHGRNKTRPALPLAVPRPPAGRARERSSGCKSCRTVTRMG